MKIMLLCLDQYKHIKRQMEMKSLKLKTGTIKAPHLVMKHVLPDPALRPANKKIIRLHIQVVVFRAKMEAARSYELLVSYHITIRCHNPEDDNLNLHQCENLKSNETLLDS